MNDTNRHSVIHLICIAAVAMIILTMACTAVYANGTYTGSAYISISNDGEFVFSDGLISGVPIAHLEIPLQDIADIDLSEWDLEQYSYTDYDTGEPDPDAPTLLKLYLYMLQYYYGSAGDGVPLVTSGEPHSFFMNHFWGHDCNLLYYVNGNFPLYYEGWGATADGILLDNGDFVDVAMYSSWGFYGEANAGFNYFVASDSDPEDAEIVFEYNAVAREPLTIQVARGMGNIQIGESTTFSAADDLTVYYGEEIDPDETDHVVLEDGLAEITFNKAGDYYVWAKGGIGESSGEPCSCAAVAKVHVEKNDCSHTPGPDKEENRVEPECEASGSYDLVQYCTKCGEELSRQKKIIPATGHDYRDEDWQVTVEPTCLEKGTEYRACRNDSFHGETREIAALGHDFGNWEVVRVATELEEGLEKRVCSRCSTEETRVIPKTPHQHGLKRYKAQSATCEESGTIEYWKCDEGLKPCGRYFRDEAGEEEINPEDTMIPATGHDYRDEDWQVTAEPTCLEKGTEYRACRNDSSHGETRELAALGHAFGKWEVVDEATELEEGLEKRVCSRCGAEETRVIPMTDHAHGLKHYAAESATCEESGTIEYWKCDEGLKPCGRYFRDEAGESEINAEDTVIPAKGHDYRDEDWEVTVEPTCLEKGTEYRACRNDSSHGETRELAALGHAFGEWEVAKEATELEEGLEKRVCSRCKTEETKTIPKTGHKHVLVYVERKEPLCEAEGNTEYWKCDEGLNPCGRYFSDEAGENEINSEDTVIQATGHDYRDEDWKVTKEPTCVEKGTEYRACRNDSSHRETRDIQPTGHTPAEEHKIEVVDKPGCEKAGKHLDITYCSTCEEELASSAVTDPALGHDWGSWTDSGEDVHRRICSRDPENHVEESSHTWDEGIVTKQPTETQKGEVTYKCTVCGHIREESVPVLEHEHALKYIDPKFPTCTEDGNSGHWRCAEGANPCGKLFLDPEATSEVSEEDVKISALGHDFGEWNRLDSNSHVRVCMRDTTHVEKEDHAWDDGVITKEAEVGIEGEMLYKCTVCGAERREGIPAPVPDEKPSKDQDDQEKPAEDSGSGDKPSDSSAPENQDQKTSDRSAQTGEGGSPVGKGASAEAADAAITGLKNDSDPAGSRIAPLLLRAAARSKNSIKLKWKKPAGAVRFVLYGNQCGKKNKMTKIAEVQKTGYTVKKAVKKLARGKYYKFIVVALDSDDNVVSTSKIIHTATSGGKAADFKAVKTRAKKNKVTLKKGKSFKLSAKGIASGKIKVKKHAAIRYESSDKTVASVNSKGAVKGISKGKCVVYAYAQNGAVKTVKVTVK